MSSANTKARFLDAPETASEETLESPIDPEKPSANRWHALDELLVDSLGQISPAYLFMCFPPRR